MLLWLILLLTYAVVREVLHRKTAYYKVTHVPYFRMRRDLGRFGEYMTYRNLRRYEKEGARFLFNLYIPKGENGTTEIDVLMLSSKGLFVFESKNYSGWIFGSERQPKWYQTLPRGRGRSRKEAFYNPIMQNRTHIRHLQELLGADLPMHSIITFSDRCTLKNVQVTSSDIHVINRWEVLSVVSSICGTSAQVLTEAQLRELFDKLYPYTQADAAVKEKHIADIRQTLNPEPVLPIDPVPEESAPAPETSAEPVPAPEAAPAPDEPTAPTCPRCGAPMTLRTAKKGANAGNQFYGCSNFPKCRYIQSL